MNISKKVLASAAVCAIFGVGVTAYAVGNSAENVPAPPGSSVEDTVKADVPNIPVDELEKNETAEPVSKDNTVSVKDPARIPHVLPSKFAPEDMDLINTGVPSLCSHTTFRAELNSEVYAAADGEVVYADYESIRFGSNYGYGSVVILKHIDDLYTLYGFMNPIQLGGKAFVKVGDTVKAGQCIGLAGNSGSSSDNGVAYACYKLCDEQYFPVVIRTKEGIEALMKKWGNGEVPKTDIAESSSLKIDTENQNDVSSGIVPEGYCGAIIDANGNIVELIPENQAFFDGIRPMN